MLVQVLFLLVVLHLQLQADAALIPSVRYTGKYVAASKTGGWVCGKTDQFAYAEGTRGTDGPGVYFFYLTNFDPRTNEVSYIGKSENSVRQRIGDHIREEAYGSSVVNPVKFHSKGFCYKRINNPYPDDMEWNKRANDDDDEDYEEEGDDLSEHSILYEYLLLSSICAPLNDPSTGGYAQNYRFGPNPADQRASTCLATSIDIMAAFNNNFFKRIKSRVRQNINYPSIGERLLNVNYNPAIPGFNYNCWFPN